MRLAKGAEPLRSAITMRLAQHHDDQTDCSGVMRRHSVQSNEG